MRIRNAALGAAALFLGSLCTASAFASTIYAQPTNLAGSWFSNSGSWNAYDNFTLAAGATITSVGWVGNNDLSSSPTSFTISFYSDSAGMPGTLLGSTTVGDGSPVDIGTDHVGDETFDYTGNINPFSAAAGTEYWISIVASPSLWEWEVGTGGDGSALSIAPGNIINYDNTDLAFSLNTGTSTTPEPSSLMFLGTSLLAAAGVGGRRFLSTR
jgi:hypothetical protein